MPSNPSRPNQLSRRRGYVRASLDLKFLTQQLSRFIPYGLFGVTWFESFLRLDDFAFDIELLVALKPCVQRV